MIFSVGEFSSGEYSAGEFTTGEFNEGEIFHGGVLWGRIFRGGILLVPIFSMYRGILELKNDTRILRKIMARSQIRRVAPWLY